MATMQRLSQWNAQQEDLEKAMNQPRPTGVECDGCGKEMVYARKMALTQRGDGHVVCPGCCRQGFKKMAQIRP